MKNVSRMSPVTTDMQRPSSLRKVSASAHIGTKDFIAIGTKMIYGQFASHISLKCVQMTVRQLIQRKLTKLLRKKAP